MVAEPVDPRAAPDEPGHVPNASRPEPDPQPAFDLSRLCGEGVTRDEYDAAWRAVYREYSPRLAPMYRRVLHPDESLDDALQAMWVAAVRHIGSYQGRGPLGAWLYRVGLNALLARRRRDANRARLAASDRGSGAPPAVGPGEGPPRSGAPAGGGTGEHRVADAAFGRDPLPGESGENAVERALLDRLSAALLLEPALSSLRDQDRTLIRLRHERGLGFDEIAAHLDYRSAGAARAGTTIC